MSDLCKRRACVPAAKTRLSTSLWSVHFRKKSFSRWDGRNLCDPRGSKPDASLKQFEVTSQARRVCREFADEAKIMMRIVHESLFVSLIMEKWEKIITSRWNILTIVISAMYLTAPMKGRTYASGLVYFSQKMLEGRFIHNTVKDGRPIGAS